MKNKKAVEMRYLVLMSVGLIALIISIFIVRDLLGKEAGETGGYLKDWDCDNVKDFFDKCPCTPGEEDNNGCLTTGTYKDGYDAAEREVCKKKMNEEKKSTC